MKSILVLLTSLLSIAGFAQHDDLISKLILTTKEGLQQKKEVTFNSQSASLQIGEWIIPISKNTVTKVELEDGQYEVEFSLQKGTAVTSSIDKNWRRASFALPFNSREAAKNFMHLFQEIAERESTD